jgi:hypothetical protein
MYWLQTKQNKTNKKILSAGDCPIYNSTRWLTGWWPSHTNLHSSECSLKTWLNNEPLIASRHGQQSKHRSSLYPFVVALTRCLGSHYSVTPKWWTAVFQCQFGNWTRASTTRWHRLNASATLAIPWGRKYEHDIDMSLDEQMLLVVMETDLIIVRTACATLYSTHLATNPTLIAFQQLLNGKGLSFSFLLCANILKDVLFVPYSFVIPPRSFLILLKQQNPKSTKTVYIYICVCYSHLYTHGNCKLIQFVFH